MSFHSSSLRFARCAAAALVWPSAVRRTTRLFGEATLAICGDWVVTSVVREVGLGVEQPPEDQSLQMGMEMGLGLLDRHDHMRDIRFRKPLIEPQLHSARYRTFRVPRLELARLRWAWPST